MPFGENPLMPSNSTAAEVGKETMVLRGVLAGSRTTGSR
jgi:hypothetical protein